MLFIRLSGLHGYREPQEGIGDGDTQVRSVHTDRVEKDQDSEIQEAGGQEDYDYLWAEEEQERGREDHAYR